MEGSILGDAVITADGFKVGATEGVETRGGGTSVGTAVGIDDAGRRTNDGVV
jgi:hypothetical protein